jgi:hypothetical protein
MAEALHRIAAFEGTNVRIAGQDTVRAPAIGTPRSPTR